MSFMFFKVYITSGLIANLTADSIEVIDLDLLTIDTLKINGESNIWKLGKALILKRRNKLFVNKFDSVN